MRSFLVLAASLLAGAASAQPPAVPSPTNLQVLPKDSTPAAVLDLMRQFTQALGVQCVYCHLQPPPPMFAPEDVAAGAGRGGTGPPPMNFAADIKDAKKVARAMLVMVKDINAKLATDVGATADGPVRVECVTCHRGVTNPRQLSDLLWDTMLAKGDSAAVALYRDLRQKYYGAQAYDFREALLPSLARRSLALNKPDDAVAWLQLNLEFYPQSAASYLVLAEAHRRQHDPGTVVRDLQKALELDPSNADARRQLQSVSR